MRLMFNIVLIVSNVAFLLAQDSTTKDSISSTQLSSSTANNETSSPPPGTPQPSTATIDESGKTIVSETADDSNSTDTNSSSPSVVIHYVDFNLTENFNKSNEVYLFNDDSLENATESVNATLIDKGRKMFSRVYNRVTSFTQSMDSNVLLSLWIPFMVGLLSGLTLICLIYCARSVLLRCCWCCCKRYRRKRNPKKIQSLEDNQYLLVSNHSDSEGV